MDNLTHHGCSIIENRVPYLCLRYEAGCTFPLDVRWFQLAIQLIGGEKRGDGEKIRCMWINSGCRPEQSSRMAGFGALKTYEKNDENMMYWMGKGEVSKSSEFVYRLVYIESGPGSSG
jgi:hypothetical protein